jgi:hypothetical protein
MVTVIAHGKPYKVFDAYGVPTKFIDIVVIDMYKNECTMKIPYSSIKYFKIGSTHDNISIVIRQYGVDIKNV